MDICKSGGAPANPTCHPIIISSHRCQDIICKQFYLHFMCFPSNNATFCWMKTDARCEKFFDLFETAHHPQSEEEEAVATKI